MSMKNETALVTGSTSGIGKKIAELFLREGCKVAICSRNEKNVNQTISEFQEKFSDSIIGFTCDVSNVEDLKVGVEKTITEFGSIRVLVANAGLNLTYGPFNYIPLEQVASNARVVLGVNLIGMMNSVAAVLPQMFEQKYGRIITLSGAGASRPKTHMTIYSASKGGVHAFSTCLAEEFNESGLHIKINIFLPGMLKTNLAISTNLVPGWRDEESYRRETALITDLIGTNIEESCNKVIPYALPTCRDNGKAFRGFSIWKMIRGGRKIQKEMREMEKNG